MTEDEISRMPSTCGLMPLEEFQRWVASREEAGSKVDIETCFRAFLTGTQLPTDARFSAGCDGVTDGKPADGDDADVEEEEWTV